MKKFDVRTVDLSGKNLVEASAGTGKTFSIAFMALRLVLEQNMPINKILMVTFTNNATAELEARLRLFTRKAYAAACGNPSDEKMINDLVTGAISKLGDKEVRNRLQEAILLLDETAVLTFHGFCQRTLGEFAFETNQIYNAELLESTGALVLDGVNDFWRNKITGLSEAVLNLVVFASGGLTRDMLVTAVYSALDKKNYLSGEADLSIVIDLETCWNDSLKMLEGFEEYVEDKRGKGLTPKRADTWKENFRSLDAKDFMIKLAGNSSAYVIEVFSVYINQFNNLFRLKQATINNIIAQAIKEVVPTVISSIKMDNYVTFDELISNIHKSIVTNEQRDLIKGLRDKYRVAFLDEFQDTDRLQYEIFDKLFDGHGTLFYIGDPKQSIYGWRKADIKTYFQAVKGVPEKNRFTMTTNYRSSKNYVASLNKFFYPEDKFDTFVYEDSQEDGFAYEEVNAQKGSCSISLGTDSLKPLNIYDGYEDDDVIISDAVNVVLGLLSKGSIEGSKIECNDISILVRTGKQGKEFKKQLQRVGVPSVMISDDKIFASAEAAELLAVLETIHDVSWKGINKALLNSFTGIDSEEILQLDNEQELLRFKRYYQIWKEQGIYATLLKYIDDYNVKYVLLGQGDTSGERTLANLYQLMEILQEAESSKSYAPSELIRFLSRKNNGEEGSEDSHIQRLESDAAAVQIITIHKSKGLEYGIVLLPFMDEPPSEKFNFTSFRSKNGDYNFVVKGLLGKYQNDWEIEQQQENRRLLYVALTRAKYGSFVFKKTGKKDRTLDAFYESLTNQDVSVLMYIGSYNREAYTNYSTGSKLSTNYPILPTISLQDSHWKKMSYSYLAGAHAYHTKPVVVDKYEVDSYSQFILKDLPRGAHVGNLLHNIVEFIDFTEKDKSRWEEVIDYSLDKFLPSFKEMAKQPLLQMLEEVLNCAIKIGGETITLRNISNQQKRNELEFDFTTARFNTYALRDLAEDQPEDYQIVTRHPEDIEGVLNGLIDLFFEYKGKYYILDWKSNFLGDQLTDYAPSTLCGHMSESNYHLQYLIYTLAIKKYLTSKLPDFDYDQHFGGVIYLFLRGVRKDAETGVYVSRPALKKIETLEDILSNTVSTS